MTSLIIALICINIAALVVIFLLVRYLDGEKREQKEKEKQAKEALKTYEQTSKEIKKNIDVVSHEARSDSNVAAINDILQHANEQGKQRNSK